MFCLLRKHNLLGKAFKSLSDIRIQSIHSVDVKLAMLLWVFGVQQCGFQDVLLAIREKSSHCLMQQLKNEFGLLLRCHGRFRHDRRCRISKITPLVRTLYKAADNCYD